MDIRADEISKIIREQIGGFAVDVDVAEVGTVISLGDAPKGYKDFDKGAARKYVIDPHGMVK